MNKSLRLISIDTDNFNKSKRMTSVADCSSPEAFSANFCSPSHLMDSSSLFKAQDREENHHLSLVDAIPSSNIFSDQSVFSQSPSSSTALDDITIHVSDLDSSLDEDTDSPIVEAKSARLRRSDSRLNERTDLHKVHRERRRRYARMGTENNARYRLECIRERNRVAARKYRQKQKDRSSKLEEEGGRLLEERDELIQTVKRLQDEVFHLKHSYLNQLCWNCGQAT